MRGEGCVCVGVGACVRACVVALCVSAHVLIRHQPYVIIIIIINVFVRRKIMSVETILSAYMCTENRHAGVYYYCPPPPAPRHTPSPPSRYL